MEENTGSKLTPIFAMDGFSFFYPEQEKPTLDDVHLSIEMGEFLVLCGASGSGKTTLLRQLKTVLSPNGHRLGEVFFDGKPLHEWGIDVQSGKIGFVGQSPENQVVTDKVWHELAFGLESLGYDTPTIRRRVAEMASFFGIQTWFYQNVSELSGGQKQLLNLASVMVMQPSVLILDEPTSQLDPIAASEFLAILGKINRELGTTIILTEHRLEEALPLANRVAVMEKGSVIAVGNSYEVGAQLKKWGHGMFMAMPTPMRVWGAVKNDLNCPVTVSEGRQWLQQFAEKNPLQSVPKEREYLCGEDVVISAKDLWFRYEKNGSDVVKGLDLEVKRGEFLAILGGNGTGKTTALKLLSGLQKPYRGEVKTVGGLGVLPQNPQTLFVKKTVREDLFELLLDAKKVSYVVEICHLEELLERHPYDLSGGEQQRVALAKILLLEPKILLLDEPTKGLDAEFKEEFAQILEDLLAKNTTILMVSHDLAFCAKYAHRCALFFDGAIVTEGTPRTFFGGNSFYTTAANRMGRGICEEVITPEDLILACGGGISPKPKRKIKDTSLVVLPEISLKKEREKLPLWRKIIAVFSALVVVIFTIQTLFTTDLSAIIVQSEMTEVGASGLQTYGYLAVALVAFTFAVGRKSTPSVIPVQVQNAERKLSKRMMMATAIILILIPITLFVGAHCFAGRKYHFIALLILLECMAPFFMIFESRKPQARELVVIAVLCGIAVAGRAIFFMLPQFKPVMAVCIIAGVAFGGETGFLVGAMSMLVSNLFFAQGPWTPWQMFAMGIIGFLAGILFRKGLLRRTKTSLATFGFLVAIVVYGGIMNPVSALLWVDEFRWSILLSYYISGLPMDVMQGIATALFLWYAAEPMLEKLERIKLKYGLL